LTANENGSRLVYNNKMLIPETIKWDWTCCNISLLVVSWCWVKMLSSSLQLLQLYY